MESADTKPVIVLVTFGSRVEQGLGNLEDFDRMVRERFPDHDVRWAWTAASIIRMLARSGVTTMFRRQIPIKTLDEVYADLLREQRTNVVVQCFLIMPGEKMRQALAYRTDGLNVKFGFPLLYDPQSIERTANALSSEFSDVGTAVVLCAHGNRKHPAYNAPFVAMDAYLRHRYDHVFLATVEGPPGSAAALQSVREAGVVRVRFVPLMLVEGDHIVNDVMSDEPDSWKTLVGLPATCETGLASNRRAMEPFLQSIADLLTQFRGA